MIQKQDKKEKTFKPPVSWKVRLRPAVFTLVLLFVVAISHASSIWNDFALDDRINIKPFGLVSVEKRKWEPVWYELYTDAFEKPFSEPMRRLTLAWDYQSGHLVSPAVYHATNVILQALGIVAAFFVLLKLVDQFSQSNSSKTNYALPLFVCALFCAHPLTSESVAYISARSSLLCFFWYMVGLACFIQGFTTKRLNLSVIGTLFAYLAMVVAIFASSQAITLPWAMLFCALLLKPAQYTYKEWLYERSFELGSILCIAIALPFLFLTKSTLPTLFMIGVSPLSNQLYCLSTIKSLSVYYLRTFFAPVGFSIYPAGVVASGFGDPFVWLSVVLVLGTLYLMWRLRTRPLFVLGLFLFLIGLIPQSFMLSSLIAHGARFYLSGFGLCLALGDFVFNALADKFKIDPVEIAKYGFSRKVALIALLPVLVLAGLSNWRDHAYKNSSSIIKAALTLDKDNQYLQALLAFKLSQEGGSNVQEGAKLATDVLNKNGQLVFALLAQANYYQSRQDYVSSANKFAEALQIAQALKLDEWIVAYCEGGVARSVVLTQDLTEPAQALKIKQFSEHALKFDPTVARLYLAHGLAVMAEGKPESAERACRDYDKGRRFDMNDPAFAYPLAQASLRTGYSIRLEPAFSAAKMAYRLKIDEKTRLLFARAALESGRLNRGYSVLEDYFKNTKTPAAEAYYILSGLERLSGRTQIADAYLKVARDKDKNVEKHRLFLSVKPKPTKDEDNQGPSSIDASKLSLPTSFASQSKAPLPQK